MTCKDCIHYDVCTDFFSLQKREFAQDFNGSEVACEHFKDKSRILELPCKVGDKVYHLQKVFNESTLKTETIVKTRVIDFVATTSFLSESDGLIFGEKDFGTTVFLTREEAEEALRKAVEK